MEIINRGKHGGARKGTGPKPKEKKELKTGITVYVLNKDIDKFNGRENLRMKILEFIEKFNSD